MTYFLCNRVLEFSTRLGEEIKGDILSDESYMHQDFYTDEKILSGTTLPTI